jgi:YD repeat-containing protein
MTRRFTLVALAFAIAVMYPSFAAAQQPIQYLYDSGGRLVGVVDPAADTVVYSYDAVGNLLSIARFASTTVSVIAFSPASAAVGATVTISGTGFSTTPGQNTVTFNGTAATVTSSTATELVTTVPSGATTGPIAVTTPSGSASSATSFVVSTSGPPTITGFTPTVGVAGNSITVSGTNYETTPSNNKTAFNVTRPIVGRVTSATSTSLSVTVPPTATSGRMSVATAAGKATSTDDFFVPPSPYTAADVVFTGRIAIGGSSVTVPIGSPGKIGLVVFDGTAGQRLNVGVSAITMPHVVGIYNPDGSSNSGINGATELHMNPLPVTGTYLILVDPNGSSTGSVTLTLSEEVTGTITVGGASLAVSIPRIGQRARIEFGGTAGQRLDLGLTSSTTSGWVSVLKPDGTIHGSSPNFTTGANAHDSMPPLPVTGTYTIFVDPAGANTGNVTLTLSEEATGTITVDGSATTATVSRAGQQARITFSGTAGDRLNLGVTSNALHHAWATLYSPSGASLSSIAISTGNAAMYMPVLPTTGTYEILIDPPSANTGSVVLTLSTEVSGTLTIGGGASTVSITRAGQRARLTFSGTAGNRLSVGVTSVTIPSGGIVILNPNGSTLANQGLAFVDVKSLGATGTYELYIHPNAAATGSATLTLYDVPADITGTLTVNGSAQTITTTAPGQKAVFTFTWNAGQQVTVRGANSTQGCVNVQVLRPDGWAPTISPCTAAYTVSTTSGTSGVFTVTVDPTGMNTGTVDLSVTNP